MEVQTRKIIIYQKGAQHGLSGFHYNEVRLEKNNL